MTPSSLVHEIKAYGESGGSHYKVLCVEESATYDEIRKKYFAAVLLLHPDKNENVMERYFKNDYRNEKDRQK